MDNNQVFKFEHDFQFNFRLLRRSFGAKDIRKGTVGPPNQGCRHLLNDGIKIYPSYVGPRDHITLSFPGTEDLLR